MDNQTQQQDFSNAQLANFNGLIVTDSDKYPNRLICIVRIKVYIDNQKPIGNWGTGCFITDKHILTAAHVIDQLKKQISANKPYKMEGYVRQALNDGKFIGTFRIKPETIKISNSFMNNQKLGYRYKDYALFQVQPMQNVSNEQKFMPIIAFKKQMDIFIQQISLYGYFYELNRGNTQSVKQSSIFMQNMFGSKGSNFSYKPKQITYQLPTQRGVSGGPIITYFQHIKQFIVIGIHKGKKINPNNNNTVSTIQEQIEQNCGITAIQMLEQINNWGYDLIKEPFIYTKQTYFLRNNPKIKKVEILNLMDKHLDIYDIYVLTAFDLSHIKKIILSGNKLQQAGIIRLLKRKYPNLQSLHLTQNQISSLDNVTKDQWENISTVSTLSISVNSLKQLPNDLLILRNLHTLNACYNDFQEIPKIIPSINSSMNQNIKVLIYQNKINEKEAKFMREELKGKNIQLVISRHQI